MKIQLNSSEIAEAPKLSSDELSDAPMVKLLNSSPINPIISSGPLFDLFEVNNSSESPVAASETKSAKPSSQTKLPEIFNASDSDFVSRYVDCSEAQMRMVR